MFNKKRVYLDTAAGVSGNASSPHREGRLASLTLEHARTKIARLVEAKPDDIIFTGGATEANALAILGSLRAVITRHQASRTKRHAMYLPSAHASVVENMKLLEEEGVDIEPLPIKDCAVDCEALARRLRRETVLVSMDAVCGETGVVWNTREVARVLKSGHRMSTFLHVDASQAPWSEKLTRAHFGADLMTLDASKVCEARGSGCLIASRAISLVPLYRGGGQERGLVPGSEAPALASAFAEGLARAVERREAFRVAAAAARSGLLEGLRAGIPSLFVNEGPNQAPHILNISLPGYDTDYLVALLDEAGFAVSTVSACETSSGEPSRAVLALFGDPIRAA